MSAHALPPGGGRSFGPGIRAKLEFGAGADFAAFESELAPGSEGPPPHLHRIYDEAFYVLSGAVSFTVDGTTTDCAAGSFVHVPRGVTHGFGNPGRDPARILVVTSPGAIALVEGIYDLLDREGPPDAAAMAALWAEHQSEIVAPVGASEQGSG